MNDKKMEKLLFNEGDWVLYNGIMHKIRSIGFNESADEIVYILGTHNSSCLESVLQSEALKCLKKA